MSKLLASHCVPGIIHRRTSWQWWQSSWWVLWGSSSRDSMMLRKLKSAGRWNLNSESLALRQGKRPMSVVKWIIELKCFIKVVVVDHFYIGVFSALEQTHCSHMWFWISIKGEHVSPVRWNIKLKCFIKVKGEPVSVVGWNIELKCFIKVKGEHVSVVRRNIKLKCFINVKGEHVSAVRWNIN